MDNSKNSYSLATNLEGRIRNLALSPSPSNSVYPMLEAIMNGYQAIQDRFRRGQVSKGIIEISVERTETGLSISVHDNGVGIDDRNFQAFLTPDTPHKIEKGGKGVGRLAWLKAFNLVRVRSRFFVKGQLFERSFRFHISDSDAVADHQYTLSSQDNEPGTLIELLEMRGGYDATFPSKPQTIADHIIRHFLPILISEKRPKVVLSDSGSEIDVADKLNQSIEVRDHEKFEFTSYDGEKHHLNITHMRIASKYAPRSSTADLMKSRSPQNVIYFAADERVCFEYVIDNQLGINSFDGTKYIGIVEGDYLNEHMNQERTNLDIPHQDAVDLKECAFKGAVSFLGSFMDRVKEIQREAFDEIETDFPTLASAAPKEYIEKLPYSMTSREEMVANLAKLRSRGVRSAKAKVKALDEVLEEGIEENEELRKEQLQRVDEIASKLRDSLTKETNATLAEHMLRRKAVIAVLEKYMGSSPERKHYKEEVIHDLICPIRKIDDEKRLLNHNLWLLDDRFSFYSFLSSDKPLRDFADSDSDRRPDVLFVLDRDLAFHYRDRSETPVFIVEFKRPNKTSYTTGANQDWDTEDPFDRFEEYIDSLREGVSGEKTFNGSRVHITASRPVHCYLIADMTKNLKKKCGKLLSPILGTNSYFGHVPNIGFVHALSYEDLLNNAKLRHEEFFKILRIGSSE